MRPLNSVGVALIVGVLMSVTPAASAQAGGGIEVSEDGVAYSPTMPGPLFTLTSALVPGDAFGEDLYVRNTSTAPGLLRVSLIDVVTTDDAIAAALTLTTTLTGGGARPAVPLSAADPCAVLLEGPILQPGETRRLHTELRLGDLVGTAGQGATAWTSIRVALVDPARPAFSSTDCGPDGTELPVLTDPNRGSDGTRASGTPGTPVDQATNAASSAAGTAPTDAAPVSSRVELPVLPLPLQAFVDPNTGELNLLLLFIVVGSFLAGMAGFILLAWRRRTARDSGAAGAGA